MVINKTKNFKELNDQNEDDEEDHSLLAEAAELREKVRVFVSRLAGASNEGGGVLPEVGDPESS